MGTENLDSAMNPHSSRSFLSQQTRNRNINTVISNILRRYVIYWLRFQYSLLFELVCILARVFVTDSLLPRAFIGFSISEENRSCVLT